VRLNGNWIGVSKVTLYRYISYMRRWVRSIKEVGAAMLMHNLYPSRGILDVLQIVATIINALLSVLMKLRNDERMKDEKLRESFKVIAKELYRAKKYVERNLENLNKTHKIVIRFDEIPLGSGNISESDIKKDFERYYRKGLEVLKHIKECNSKIKKYNKRYDKFIEWLYGRIEEKLKERGIRVDDDIKVALMRLHLDRVLRAHKSKERLPEELASLYQEITSSDEFINYTNELKKMIKDEVKPCLETLKDKLDKVIDDIVKRFTLSEQEIATEEDQPDLRSLPRPPLKLLIADHDRLHANNKRRAPKA